MVWYGRFCLSVYSKYFQIYFVIHISIYGDIQHQLAQIDINIISLKKKGSLEKDAMAGKEEWEKRFWLYCL